MRRVVLGLLSPNYLVNVVLANPEGGSGFTDLRLISLSRGVFWPLDRPSEPAGARIDHQQSHLLANQLHVLVFKRLRSEV
jgi:hypothetical protein